MKVLHILDFSLPHRQSGYSIRSKYIVDTQKALGFEPIVLTRCGGEPTGNGLLDGPDYVDAVPYWRDTAGSVYSRSAVRLGGSHLPGTARVYRAGIGLRLRKRIARVIEAETPDVLQAASPGGNALAAIDVGHRYGLPVVYEVRGLWHDSEVAQGMLDPHSDAYQAQHAEHVVAMQRADAVVTLSEMLKVECTREGIAEDKVAIVPNAVAEAQCVPAERSVELAGRLGVDRSIIFRRKNLLEGRAGALRIGYEGYTSHAPLTRLTSANASAAS